jgi:hypothetical protein
MPDQTGKTEFQGDPSLPISFDLGVELDVALQDVRARTDWPTIEAGITAWNNVWGHHAFRTAIAIQRLEAEVSDLRSQLDAKG